MVTASHLPPATNGIKLCREQAIPLSGDEGLPALQRMVEEMSVRAGRVLLSRLPARTGPGI